MSKKLIFPFLVALAVALLFVSCSPRTQSKADAARQKKDNFRQEVLQMSSKHGADINWLAILDGREFYTLELQQALLEPAGRSRLLLAVVVDVMKRENGYILTARDWMSDVYFQLLCDAKQAQYIMDNSTNNMRMFDEYAIVIKPESVHKPVAQLADEIAVDYAYVTQKAIVKGTCIDILSLNNSGLNSEDLLRPKSEEKR